MARAPRKFLLLIAAAAVLLFAGVLWLTNPPWAARTTASRGARSASRATTTLGRAAWQAPSSGGATTGTPDKLAAQPSPASAPASASSSARPDETLPAATPPQERAAPDQHQQPEANPRETALRQQLETITAQHTAATIRFVRCDGENCRARVEITEADEANKFVAAARRAALGQMEIRMQERITAFNGRMFQADMKISGGEGRSTM